MPTMLLFPEILETPNTYVSWLNNPRNRILDYRNVWVLSTRNFGASDHHNSFELSETVEDVNRFIESKQLSTVTVAGHGYGAKVACAFGSNYTEKTTGVVCLEGGPLDHSYYAAWQEISSAIDKCANIKLENTNLAVVGKEIEKAIEVNY